jgi:hypothetical protein
VLLRPLVFDNLSFGHLGIALDHPERKEEQDDMAGYTVRRLCVPLESCSLDEKALKLVVGGDGKLKLGSATFKPYVKDMVLLRKI